MSTGRPSAELAAAMVPRVEAREAVTVSTVTPPVVGALGTAIVAVMTTLPAATPMATAAASTPGSGLGLGLGLGLG